MSRLPVNMLLDLLDRRLEIKDIKLALWKINPDFSDNDWENFAGETRREKLQSILSHFSRREQIDVFLSALKLDRPDLVDEIDKAFSSSAKNDPDMQNDRANDQISKPRFPRSWTFGSRRRAAQITAVAVTVALIAGGYVIKSQQTPAMDSCPQPAAPPALGSRSETVHVPSASYLVARMQDFVTVDEFEMQRYEVTNADYLQYIKKVGGRLPGSWVNGEPLREQLLWPVTDVDQSDAAAYCASVGMRLPSEIEWEYACTSGKTGRIYPWGNEWDTCRANTGISEISSIRSIGAYSRVSRSGNTDLGIADMSGNVAEWSSSPDGFVLGGSWRHTSLKTATCSSAMVSESGNDAVGFRCIR